MNNDTTTPLTVKGPVLTVGDGLTFNNNSK